MSCNRIHFKDKLETYEFYLFYFFIFLILFGLYKNGLTYYFQGLIPFKEAIKPLVFPLISLIIFGGMKYFFKKGLSIEDILIGIILSLIVPPMFPIWLYLLLVFFFSFFFLLLHKKIKTISFLLIYKIIMIFFTSFFSIGLENIIEKSFPYAYGTLDMLFGTSVGSFGTTHIFGIILFYFVLCNYFYYKRDLPIYAIGSYSIMFFLIFIIKPNFYELKDYFSSSFFFCAIFFLPINSFSPALPYEKRIYGITFGIISYFLIHFFSILESPYLVLFLIQILWSIYLHFYIRQKVPK